MAARKLRNRRSAHISRERRKEREQQLEKVTMFSNTDDQKMKYKNNSNKLSTTDNQPIFMLIISDGRTT